MRYAGVGALMLVAALLVGCRDDQADQGKSAPAPRSPATVTNAPSGGRPGAEPTSRAFTRLPAARRAQPFDPAAFQLGLEAVASDLNQPVFVTHAGDGSGRLFIVERAGRVRLWRDGSVRPEPFLDVSKLIRANGTEQGLLGLAFHPRYSENGRFWVYYTATDGDNTLAEYRVSTDANRADQSSGRVLFAVEDFAANHNGGMVAFGPDGYLYIGLGDGGGAGDPQRTGQKLDTLLGKLLRLDVDGGQPYVVPADNPFVGREGSRGEIWAYGLRNPWRFSFDRLTGDLWIADVGQNKWEEINVQPAGAAGGANYGWSIMEGAHCFRPDNGCDQSGLTLPVAEYDRDGGCSVTGGYVYRGSAAPALVGAYLYGDFCSGRIWAAYPEGNGYRSTELLQQRLQLSSFGEDEAGEVYVVSLDGRILRVTATPR